MYKQLSHSQISFKLTLKPAKIKTEQQKIIAKYRQNITVSGFRQGHAPEAMIVSKIGQQKIISETLESAFIEIYQQFLQDNKITPVSSPKTKWPSVAPDKTDQELEVEVTVEVFPEPKLGNYQSIKADKIKKEPANEKDIDEALSTIMAAQNIGKPVDRAAKKGDLLVIDWSPIEKKGDPLPENANRDVSVRLGMGHLPAEMEKILDKAMPDSEHTTKIPLPAANGQTEKKMIKVKLKAIKEINPQCLTAEQIKQFAGTEITLEKLRENIGKSITDRRLQAAKKQAIDKYVDKLIAKIPLELPQSWIDREFQTQWQKITDQPAYQKDPESFWQQNNTTKAKAEAEITANSTRQIKSAVILSKIIAAENITTTAEEEAQAKAQAKEPINEESLRLNLCIDKYFDKIMLESLS